MTGGKLRAREIIALLWFGNITSRTLYDPGRRMVARKAYPGMPSYKV